MDASVPWRLSVVGAFFVLRLLAPSKNKTPLTPAVQRRSGAFFGNQYGTGGGTRTHTGHRSQRIFFLPRLSPACRLDFLFTLEGVPRQVSAPSLSGLAQGCHLTGFPEFEGLHSNRFQSDAQKISPLRLPIPPPRRKRLSCFQTGSPNEATRG